VGVLWRDGNLNNIAVSRDGRTIATAVDSRDITLWRGATPIRTITATARVTAVDLSADGTMLAAGDQRGQIRVWSADQGVVLFSASGPRRAAITSLALSPSGRLVATGDSEGVARVWDRLTGRELVSFADNTGGIHGIGFTTDGLALITVDWNDIFSIRLIPGLDLPIEELEQRACRILSAPSTRRFSDAEIDRDPSISRIWGRSSGNRLCASVG
jgi:WD40 repeat protein